MRLTEVLPHTTGLYTQFIKTEYLVENYLNLSSVIFHLNKCGSMVLALGKSRNDYDDDKVKAVMGKNNYFIYLFLFSTEDMFRGMEREKKREIDWLSPVQLTVTGNQTCNLGMCPD